MPDLAYTLQGHDLGGLRIIAELWGIDLNAPDQRRAAEQLARAIHEPARVHQLLSTLPAEAQQALNVLAASKGKLRWTQFTRRFGDLRDMGPARRDRERPHLNPVSAAETLWYRALVARAFFDTPSGPQEFAYIPEDLLALLPAPASASRQPLGRAAEPHERPHPRPANDRILDAACTFLAALRVGMSDEQIEAIGGWPLRPAALRALLNAAGLLAKDGAPHPEKTRAFLEANRGAALAQLASAWLNSREYDDLRLLPHLLAEGRWRSDPLQTRRAILDMLNEIPAAEWWSLSEFIAAVHRERPEFQRPTGDYDSWYLRDTRTGEYLRGFEHWRSVEGALLGFVITGPLHALGILDLAAADKDSPAAAFRVSPWAETFLAGKSPKNLPKEDQRLRVDSKGQITVPRLAPRAVRYQVARFCAWEGRRGDAYLYRLNAAALAGATAQGLQPAQVLALLRRHADPGLPPNIIEALKRWEQHGPQARLENVVVLRVSSPDVLQEIRKSRAARFLGDPLGPTAIAVKPGARQKVLEILLELGHLGLIEGTNE